jgi:hypothetical protein
MLTPEIIDVLAHMVDEEPQSKEWHQIARILSKENIVKIMDRRIELQQEEERRKRALMSEEEIITEAEQRKRWKESLSPGTFLGNMGQPETPEEYKYRYGRYPPGYDENGNKIENA